MAGCCPLLARPGTYLERGQCCRTSILLDWILLAGAVVYFGLVVLRRI